jgi:hypothetical protein
VPGIGAVEHAAAGGAGAEIVERLLARLDHVRVERHAHVVVGAEQDRLAPVAQRDGGREHLLHHEAERIGDSAGEQVGAHLDQRIEFGKQVGHACAPQPINFATASINWPIVSISACMFMLMMMSNSSSIAATKSITVRLSHSRSPAKVVASESSTPFLLKMQGNLTLSQMADQKANMIIGASFVIFTLSVGQIHAGTMLLPIAVLATGAFLAAICAIICVLPRVSKAKGALGPGDNLLFFGVYSQLSEENFSDEVLGRLQCDEDAYRMMLRDIYQNGQVLARKKYRFLGYAYRAFLTGLVGSFVLLVLELITGLRL